MRFITKTESFAKAFSKSYCFLLEGSRRTILGESQTEEEEFRRNNDELL